MTTPKLALLALLLLSCPRSDTRPVVLHLAVPGFHADQVQGITVWREGDALSVGWITIRTSDAAIEEARANFPAGAELIHYTSRSPITTVVFDVVDEVFPYGPGTTEMFLAWLRRGGQGTFRVRSYNVAGSSLPSNARVY